MKHSQHLLGQNPADTWSNFIQRSGPQCVINPSISMVRYYQITQGQWQIIEPLFLHLTGLDRSILDYGCGPGRFLPFFDKFFGTVIGYDPCPAMFQHIPEGHAICFAQPKRKFDVVFCWLVLGDPEVDMEIAVKEMATCLEPNGTVIVADHCEHWKDGKYRWRFHHAEAYQHTFAEHGIRLTHMLDVDQNGNSVSVFKGTR